MITIINYGMGNLGSIKNMFKKIGVGAMITSDPLTIDVAKKIILPGVGAFDRAIENLNSLNLIEVLNKKALIDKVPILGICLGMQLLTKKSEEGDVAGLGYLDAEVKKFNFNSSIKLKIPHMGWNTIKIEKTHLLFKDLDEKLRFYFVHSYHIECEKKKCFDFNRVWI